MSVIELKPHLLSYLETTPGFEDDNGDWHEGSTSWSKPFECHAVPAGAANEITFADGSTFHYSYIVGRLDADCREFKIGEDVKLIIEGMERKFQVKGFHRYQLQSKLWL